jgi:hypothetical protein
MRHLIAATNGNAGRSITYLQGSTTDTLNATPLLRRYEVIDDGIHTIVNSWDFLVLIADMDSFDAPRAGDEITATINGTAFTFEVMPLGNLPCYEPDGQNLYWRVHTKKVNEE